MVARVDKVLMNFTPEQRGFAEAVTTMKIENAQMRKQLADLKTNYDELWKIIITLLDFMPEKEMRIHESQFLRFKEEYRMEKDFDKETGEVVLKLRTFVD